MRSLDFIVFGIGRSGTTALAKSLNMHPDILCGIERFHYAADPRSIQFPESFSDTTFKSNPKNLTRTLELMASKGPDVAIVGDKNPRYYCNIEAWQKFKPGLAKIAIYRSPYEYLASWKNRADNPKDVWHPELHGAFGIYELFGMLRDLLAHGDDTLMVPYDAFYFGNDQLIFDILKFMGADTARFPFDEFRKKIFMRSSEPRTRPELSADVNEMLAVAKIDVIDEILLRDGVYRIGEVRSEIEAWMQSIPSQLGDLAEKSFQKRDSQALHKLLLFWVRHFPQTEAMPNPAAVPPVFKLYHDLLYTSGRSRWAAVAALARKTRTNPVKFMVMARGQMAAGNLSASRSATKQAIVSIVKALQARSGT